MIYRLNLPPLSECILENVAEQYLINDEIYRYSFCEPEKFFKSEYLTIKNLPWAEVLIFSRTEKRPGIPHTDNVDPYQLTSWGINWIHGGIGVMEYWEPNDFPPENIKFMIDKHNYHIFHYIPNRPARLKYVLKPGAYLVNTSMVHRATGFGNRHCVSYRAPGKSYTWNGVINLFDDLIDGVASVVV